MSILRLLDDTSPQRVSLLKLLFSSYEDILRFYLFSARLGSLPLIGSLLLKPLTSQYGLRLHGGVALPLPQAMQLLEEAKSIVATECQCRTLQHRCDLPRMNCLKINTAGDLYLAHGRRKAKQISLEEAQATVRASVERGMFLQLEWCVAPYSYDICSCCTCCCVATELRFKHGIKGAVAASPFVPVALPEVCNGCGQCVELCPAAAVAVNGTREVDLERCIGCGLCAQKCSENAIEMVESRSVKSVSEPSAFRKSLYWLLAVTLLLPQVATFKLVRR